MLNMQTPQQIYPQTYRHIQAQTGALKCVREKERVKKRESA